MTTPVPRGDDRHDIGDDTRAAIARRLCEGFQRFDPSLSTEQARRLAMFAAADVRALLSELGTLLDMSQPVQETEK